MIYVMLSMHPIAQNQSMGCIPFRRSGGSFAAIFPWPDFSGHAFVSYPLESRRSSRQGTCFRLFEPLILSNRSPSNRRLLSPA